MALDWLPTGGWHPALLPPVPHLPSLTVAATSVPATIPIPDVLHTTWFLPPIARAFAPGPPLHQPLSASAALLDVSVVSPLAWAPASLRPRPAAPPGVQRDPLAGSVVPYEAIVATYQIGGRLRQPPPLRTWAQDRSGLLAPLPPQLTAICVQWDREGDAEPDLTAEGLTVTGLTAETLTTSALLAEDLC